jgi:hypothetical protein
MEKTFLVKKNVLIVIGLFVFAGQVGILQSLLAQVFGVEFRL